MVWYEDEVKRLETIIESLPTTSGTVFYGSSSIRLWDSLEKEFHELSPINMGFGGPTLAACSWFFERIFDKLSPNSLIVYAGDNDLGDGRSAEEVFLFFNELVRLVHEKYGNIPLGFISIKPSISRWEIVDKIRHTNHLIEAEINKRGGHLCYINIYDAMTDKTGYPIREYLEPDGLHINGKGYELWTSIIKKYISSGALPLMQQPS